MNFSIDGHLKQAPVRVAWVWFEGATALSEGQGVCYNYDYGTDSVADGRRGTRVELPSTTNARYFAGVAARDYSAVSTGQMIEIYLPGSICNVLAKANCDFDAGLITCEAGGTYAGYFRYAGFEGEGSAVPLQDVDRSGTAGKVLAKLQEGLPSGLVENVTVVDDDAITPMVGGVTYLTGADITTGHCTAALADAVYEGLRKKFYVLTEIGTNDLVVTPDTAGIQLDGSSALASFSLDSADEEITLESCSGIWVTRGLTGATEA